MSTWLGVNKEMEPVTRYFSDNFFTVLCLIVSTFCSVVVYASPESGKPNILLILADDLSWFDLGCYGSKDVNTPNIDKLAREGMTFNHAYTATAMCAPTRQQLYTGVFPVRSGAMGNHSSVKTGTKSMVHHLSELGYEVSLSGKEHFGPPASFPFEKREGLKIPSGPEPFCLVLASKKPHDGWPQAKGYDPRKLTVPPYLVDNLETRRSLARYFTEITQLDDDVGKLMADLKAKGKAKNTVVIFTSEQGSAFYGGKWTCYDRGLKTAFIVKWPGQIKPGSQSDALIQYVDVVPTLVEIGGGNATQVNTGRTGAPGGGDGFDGKSFLEVLYGKTMEHNSYVYGVHTMQGAWIGGPYPIRSVRDKKYKYIWNPMHKRFFVNFNNIGNRLNCWQSWLRDAKTNPEAAEIVRRWVKRPEVEFYDTEKDPYELKNLAKDPGYAELMERMKKRLESWMAQQGDLGVETELNSPQSSKENHWQPRLEKYYQANKSSYDLIFRTMKMK
ncbi:MAG: sulfatase [Opitutales bacterium]